MPSAITDMPSPSRPPFPEGPSAGHRQVHVATHRVHGSRDNRQPGPRGPRPHASAPLSPDQGGLQHPTEARRWLEPRALRAEGSLRRGVRERSSQALGMAVMGSSGLRESGIGWAIPTWRGVRLAGHWWRWAGRPSFHRALRSSFAPFRSRVVFSCTVAFAKPLETFLMPVVHQMFGRWVQHLAVCWARINITPFLSVPMFLFPPPSGGFGGGTAFLDAPMAEATYSENGSSTKG